MSMRSGAMGERVPEESGRSREIDDPLLRRVIRREMAEREGRAGAARAGGEAVIEMEEVYLSFDEPILKGMTLEVRKGETLLVLGESGIGKSTILKLILRLLVPDEGNIRVLGRETRDISFDKALDMRRRIGMVFQNAALFDSVNVFDNVAYPLRENTRMPESEIEAVVRERLAFVDLDPDTVSTKLPGELSGGMKKRVGIARAIATDPQIVLYDEPTAGLDPLTVGTIGDLIRKLQRELDVTSIVVTHDIRAGFRVASRVNLIRDGRNVFDGTPEDMIADDDPYIQRFLALS
jgi:phospholipid/cholesterol/gamma-HCH transport system ATP-binding protein